MISRFTISFIPSKSSTCDPRASAWYRQSVQRDRQYPLTETFCSAAADDPIRRSETNRKCILTEKERTRPEREKIAPSSSKAPVKLRETGLLCRNLGPRPLPSVRLLQATFNPKILVFGILNPKPSSAEISRGSRIGRLYLKKAKRTRNPSFLTPGRGEC